MARRTTSRSAVDSDGASPAIAAQQRIFQVSSRRCPPNEMHASQAADLAAKLKKERDEKIKDVASKVLSDLDGIKQQVSQEREERERQRKQKKAKILSDIAKSMQKRSAIEEDMLAVVADMNTAMTQLEEHVMEVCDVKERKLQDLLRDD